MATTAALGSQNLLKRGDGASPEVFTTVYEVINVEIGQDNPLVRATHLLSTSEEFIYGLPEGIEIPMVVNYKSTDATHVGLLADQANKVTRNFKLTLSAALGGTSFSFAALVIGWRLNFVSSEVVHASFRLKISGAITGPV